MKKHILILTALIILTVFTVGCDAAQEVIEPTSGLEESDDPDFSRVQIGFSLSGTGAFYDQLAEDIRQACEKLDYEANIVTADTGEKQQRDVLSMVSAGVAVIVIDPVDVDVFESVLAECELSGVPVIGIIDQINGRYSTLISPDYLQIGESAAKRAVALFEEGNGRCLELKADYDGFIMQLLSDGFYNTVAGAEGVEVVESAVCGSDEEKAYNTVKDNIRIFDVNFIFAHNAPIARGALRAIEESGKSIHLVAYAGDMDLIKSVQAGKIEAAIFFGTKQLADMAVGIADEFIKSATFEPDGYIELDVDIVTAENVAGYISETLKYAQPQEEGV